MDHALAGPQQGKWLVSRDAEYNSQMENHTWDLVYLPNGKKAIQCKWLAKIKTDEKGEPSVYKSRLVAKGFQQKEKEDYKEVFAPTAKSPMLRVLLAVAAVRKWKGQYIHTLAEKYSLQEEQTVVTPLPSEFKLIKAAEGEGVECEDQRQFQSMVGSLLYAVLGEGKVFLSCFADATWASEHEDSSSVGGYICMMGAREPLPWHAMQFFMD
ncbi:hypothetical protein CLOP_g18956 [Closterium sp. NIES-67]|nr:hypothetical protein CLOP_g18956 [Closterium sp. NIES-67]